MTKTLKMRLRLAEKPKRANQVNHSHCSSGLDLSNAKHLLNLHVRHKDVIGM
jgi:hypothetical protein